MDRLPLPPQLLTLTDEFRRVAAQLKDFSATMNLERWRYRPASDSWSAIECVEHLNLTSTKLIPMLQEALQSAAEQKLAGHGSFRMDLMGWLLLRALESKSRFMKVKTAQPFKPKEISDPDSVLRNFFDLQEKLIACVEQAGDLPVDKLKIRSPFDARVQYSVYSAFRILAAHERRHLRQAEQAAGAAA